MLTILLLLYQGFGNDEYMRNFGGETSWKKVGCEHGSRSQASQNVSQWQVLVFIDAKFSDYIISVISFIVIQTSGIASDLFRSQKFKGVPLLV
jgi:hypothetical protein